MRLGGLLLILVGAGVFSLPFWLPRVAEVTAALGAFEVAGQIGGGLIGVGVVFLLIGLFRRTR
jgi:hypothetical protein